MKHKLCCGTTLVASQCGYSFWRRFWLHLRRVYYSRLRKGIAMSAAVRCKATGTSLLLLMAIGGVADADDNLLCLSPFGYTQKGPVPQVSATVQPNKSVSLCVDVLHEKAVRGMRCSDVRNIRAQNYPAYYCELNAHCDSRGRFLSAERHRKDANVDQVCVKFRNDESGVPHSAGIRIVRQ